MDTQVSPNQTKEEEEEAGSVLATALPTLIS